MAGEMIETIIDYGLQIPIFHDFRVGIPFFNHFTEVRRSTTVIVKLSPKILFGTFQPNCVAIRFLEILRRGFPCVLLISKISGFDERIRRIPASLVFLFHEVDNTVYIFAVQRGKAGIVDVQRMLFALKHQIIVTVIDNIARVPIDRSHNDFTYILRYVERVAKLISGKIVAQK